MTNRPRTDGGSRDGPSKSGHSLQLSYTLDADEAPSTGVITATAILTDTAPMHLDPLYDVVDPDHLDGMFESSREGTAFVETTFIYNDCRVTVTPGEVHVRRLSEYD